MCRVSEGVLNTEAEKYVYTGIRSDPYPKLLVLHDYVYIEVGRATYIYRLALITMIV